MSRGRVLIAGIGNVFLGDDGFGVAVARRLCSRPLPEGVDVMDAGIRGFDLGLALGSGYEAAILVDTVRRGGDPGTLYVLEPEVHPVAHDPGAPGTAALEMHALGPANVLAYLDAAGTPLGTLRIVGCEPAAFGSDEEPTMELSVPVEAALDPAVRLVERLAVELLAVSRPGGPGLA